MLPESFESSVRPVKFTTALIDVTNELSFATIAVGTGIGPPSAAGSIGCGGRAPLPSPFWLRIKTGGHNLSGQSLGTARNPESDAKFIIHVMPGLTGPSSLA